MSGYKRNRNNYVIKQIRQTLAENNLDSFQAAVASIATEAKILSQLDHPNILKIFGMSAATCCKKGDDDSMMRGKEYFIVLDKLDETLSQRMDRWRTTTFPTKKDIERRNPKLHYSYQIALALQ